MDTKTRNGAGLWPQARALPPYIRANHTAPLLHWKTAALLFLVTLAALFWYGKSALELIAATVSAAVLGEIIGRRLFGSPTSLYDGHAVLTGLVLALMLPPSLPVWMAAMGGFTAVFVGRELFGGVGQNPFHASLVGHAILLVNFPVAMNHFVMPGSMAEGMPPLAAWIYGAGPGHSVWDFILGNHAGALGETCVLVIAIAGSLMIWQKLVFWEIPVLFLTVLYALSHLLGKSPQTELLTGGAFFAAFFILNDYASTPHTRAGWRVFAVICAAFTALIRNISVYPDGITFAVLLANACCPWIDQIVRPKGLESDYGRQET